jgi:hypothetical protein
MPKRKIAVMLDGGHVRVYTKKAGYQYVPDYIEKIAHACATADEEIHRALYYDCAPFVGSATLPISGQKSNFRIPTAGCMIWPRRIYLRFDEAC